MTEDLIAWKAVLCDGTIRGTRFFMGKCVVKLLIPKGSRVYKGTHMRVDKAKVLDIKLSKLFKSFAKCPWMYDNDVLDEYGCKKFSFMETDLNENDIEIISAYSFHDYINCMEKFEYQIGDTVVPDEFTKDDRMRTHGIHAWETEKEAHDYNQEFCNGRWV